MYVQLSLATLSLERSYLKVRTHFTSLYTRVKVSVRHFSLSVLSPLSIFLSLSLKILSKGFFSVRPCQSISPYRASGVFPEDLILDVDNRPPGDDARSLALTCERSLVVGALARAHLSPRVRPPCSFAVFSAALLSPIRRRGRGTATADAPRREFARRHTALLF